jgi:hypothetical protein
MNEKRRKKREYKGNKYIILVLLLTHKRNEEREIKKNQIKKNAFYIKKA